MTGNIEPKATNGFEDWAIWKLKLRLQFTGWLQYLISGFQAVLLLVIAGLGWLIGIWPVLLVGVPLTLASLLAAIFLFDLATLKYGFRPSESLPAAKDGLDAFDLMRARKSCRSYQARNLTAGHLAALQASAREHSQPARQLGERPIRIEYVAAPLTVWPAVGAHEFFVAIAPKEYNRMAVIDIGRSLQKVVLDATRMGLGTCWIGPGADQQSVIRHLGDRFDPARDHVICVCAIGYASWLKPLGVRLLTRTMSARKPLRDLFFADVAFTTPLATDRAPFSRFGRCYEACQWSPSSYNGQTSRAAVIADASGRVARIDFAAATESRYYAAVALGIWCANWETGCQALGLAGHFARLSPKARGVGVAPSLPHYDISWLPD